MKWRLLALVTAIGWLIVFAVLWTKVRGIRDAEDGSILALLVLSLLAGFCLSLAGITGFAAIYGILDKDREI